MVALLEGVLFPPAPSLLLAAASVTTVVSMAGVGLSEATGRQHLQYSKFRDASPSSSSDVVGGWRSKKVPGRVGMLSIYTPALAAAVAAFPAGFAGESSRAFLLSFSLALHFLKRDLEVLFVHRYSGYMVLGSVTTIALHYFLLVVLMIYGQHLTLGMSEPSINLKYIGAVLFLVGMLGNFYHHYLLSKLRGENGKEYKIPKGGLFSMVVCPHYLFEILDFYGMAFIAQAWTSLAFAVATTFYLSGRSVATRKWYLSKFEDFPKEVKALIPFVF